MSNPFVRRLEHGTALANDDRAALVHLTRNARNYDPRHVLVPEGEPAPHMLVVLGGWACRYKTVREGSCQITDLILPGDACHPDTALLGYTDHSIMALNACRIAEINPLELASVLDDRPGAARALRWSSLQTDGILRAALTNIGRRPAELRVAHLICEVRARLMAVGLVNEGGFAWPLTQSDVADACGLTSVHMNRTYRALREAGLFVLEGRRMSLPDPERLAEHCGFRPDYLHLASPIASRPAGTTSDDAPIERPSLHP